MISFNLTALFLATFFVLFEAKMDSVSKNIKGEPYDKNKKIEAFVYCIAFCSLMLIFGLFYKVYPFHKPIVFELKMFSVSLWYWAIRLIIFDYAYNVFRGLDLFYLGTTATTDKLLTKLNINSFELALYRFLLGELLIILAIFL